MSIESQSLKPVEGVAEQIGYYISGLREVREQLRDVVADLTVEETSAKLMPSTHSIGQLILHCGEAEWWWIHSVVSERPIDREEAKQKAHWDVLMDENFAEHGYTAEFCVSEIDQISDWSLEVLAKLQDHDLGRLFGYENREGERIEKSLRWILHHLIDHEAQHKGQILMLKRLLRENK